MMDLTQKALPNTVAVGGRAYSIYTDYRLWMRFENDVRKMQSDDVIDIKYLFKNEFPVYCSVTDLFQFSRPACKFPRHIGDGSGCRVIDYELDADMIYSAFFGQYGIDLIDIEELHWHKFLALLRGLNSSTKMREVMGYRSYTKQKPDNSRDIYEELKAAWEIEEPLTPEEQEELDKFNDMFKKEVN